jgi:hypothetical protein
MRRRKQETKEKRASAVTSSALDGSEHIMCKRETELRLSRLIQPTHTTTSRLAVADGITARH